jgi:hypothetical protein
MQTVKFFDMGPASELTQGESGPAVEDILDQRPQEE